MKVSVIIPNYNHAPFLQRVLTSVVNQTRPADEIIVVDDTSTDNSLEVLNSFVPQVKVIRNQKNRGCNASMNIGAAASSGSHLLFIAADDELRPGAIADMAEGFKCNPKAGLCSGEREWNKDGLKWISGIHMPRRTCYLPPRDLVELCKEGKLAVNQNALFRRAAFFDAGMWNERLQWFSDWFLDAVVIFRHGMCHVPTVVSNFHLQQNSYWNRATAAQKRKVMYHIVTLIQEDESLSDVAPLIRESGFLGEFGWDMAKIVMRRRDDWANFSPAFFKLVARRCMESAGTALLPKALAKWCLRVFYTQTQG